MTDEVCLSLMIPFTCMSMDACVSDIDCSCTKMGYGMKLYPKKVEFGPWHEAILRKCYKRVPGPSRWSRCRRGVRNIHLANVILGRYHLQHEKRAFHSPEPPFPPG